MSFHLTCHTIARSIWVVDRVFQNTAENLPTAIPQLLLCGSPCRKASVLLLHMSDHPYLHPRPEEKKKKNSMDSGNIAGCDGLKSQEGLVEVCPCDLAGHVAGKLI